MKNLIFLFLYLTPIDGSIIHGIINGAMVKKRSIPYVVSIQVQEIHFCGGTILTQLSVLTAAHCFSPQIEPWEYYVVAGSSRRDRGQRYDVESYTIHPNFTRPNDNDLAIIKLQRGVLFSRYISPLPINRLYVPGGEIVRAYGWGRLSLNSSKPYDLQTLTMKTVNYGACKKIFEGLLIRPLPDEHLCLMNEGSDTGLCLGDSGSPIVYQGKLIGIVAWVFQGCRTDYPNVVIRLFPYYIKWINDVINSHLYL